MAAVDASVAPAVPRNSGTAATAAVKKRAEDWSRSEVEAQLLKYTRTEDRSRNGDDADGAAGNGLDDPLVALVADERQRFLIKFLADSGNVMARYDSRCELARQLHRDFRTRHTAEIGPMLAPRGRVINLPVNIIDMDEENGSSPKASPLVVKTATTAAAAATAADPNKEEDDDKDDDASSSSSSESDEPIEPSADAPRPPLLDNADLAEQLETLMIEGAAFGLACVKVQEYLVLTIGALDAEDTEVMEIQAKLMEEFGEAKDVANERYDFYSTYLDVRGDIEAKIRAWPDVQSYRELLIARDESAWEEIIRSWSLLRSTLATLASVVASNIRYVVAPDIAIHAATESSLFM